MQATLVGANGGGYHSSSSSSNSSSQLVMSGAMIHNVGGSSNCTGGYAPPLLSADSGCNYPNHHHQSPIDYHVMAGSPSTFYGGGLGISHEIAADNFFPVPTTQMGGGYTKSDTISIFCQSTSNLNYPSGKFLHLQSIHASSHIL